MLKLLGLYSIPEWAICYLANGDTGGLSEEEVACVDEWCISMENLCDARRIGFNFDVMDEGKYGNAYRRELDESPEFGREFGACTTWNIPVYINIDSDDEYERFTFVVTGKDYAHNMVIHVEENFRAMDEDEVEVHIQCYYEQHLMGVDWFCYPADKTEFTYNTHK